MKCTLRYLVLATLLFFTANGLAIAEEVGWKAGVARTIITPQQPLWMAGYGGRNHPAEGTYHELWIRVLALQDKTGHTGIVLCSDTLGIPQSIYNNTCKSLKAEFDLDPDQIMLHSTHTHSGPVLREALQDVYPVNKEQAQAIEDYAVEFEKKIVETVGAALSKLVPAKVSGGEGVATFAVNRRNNREADVPAIRKAGKLKGPVDHSVPVLAVRSMDDKLMAVVFGYACHNTCLSWYQWCGDYSGFAQYAIEDVHPDAVAMFYMGCGADQNPIPRRTLERAKGYGLRLAAAVERVLAEPMQEFKPKLRTELELVTLNLGKEPTREFLEKLAAPDRNYQHWWAKRLLKDVNDGTPLERTYPLPLQAWKLGEKQLWITMGGEVVVEYSLGFKKQYGDSTWVAGYCNDVMAYIPSLRILDEGGYEGNTSMMVYGRGAERWADDIENLIAASADRLIQQLDAPED